MQVDTLQKPTYEELAIENVRLKAELANLKRLIFGQKRERFFPAGGDENQMVLTGFDQKNQPEIKTEQISYIRHKVVKNPSPHSRQPLPSHLPRKEIVIEPEEDTKDMKKIGEEITEELEYKPGSLYVNRYIRPKYARADGEGIVIGMLPSRPIEKGMAGPGLLAHIMISKFVDHLPIYRQRKQFLRQGVDLPETTVYGWVKASCDLLLPLYEVQKKRILASDYLMVDETPIRVLDPMKSGVTHQGYYWVYYDPVQNEALFDYRMSRSRAGPNELLENFIGHLQTDGYTGYDEVSGKKEVVSVGCMAHGRRYFMESRDSNTESSDWMLTHIQKLYKIERQAREAGLSPKERYQLRQEKSVPVLEAMKAWLDQESLKVLPKSVMGKAIGYMINQWPRLVVYVTDGRLEIDNNLVENAIRPVALGRKNYLFAGSHDGARQAALIYTMVSNARLKNLDSFSYIRDVISRISDHPQKRIDELLACNWKPALQE
jgi:transposase